MKRYLLIILSLIFMAAAVDAAPAPQKKKSTKTSKSKAKPKAPSAAELVTDIEGKIDAYDYAAAAEQLNVYTDHDDMSDSVAEALDERIRLGNSMLGRVEKIVVIDSLVVDKEAFFTHFNIHPSAGSLSGADRLPAGFPSDRSTVVYSTESGQRMLWSAPAKGKKAAIYESHQLVDGSWEKPTLLGEAINAPSVSNVAYPYVLSDGITLYFASNDKATSLGGYDIYVSRFDGDKFLEPQNVGMPYNSAYDDYLLAIDELTGAGWWATDRNRIPGKLTIYIYIPKEMRVNYPSSTPGLVGLAKLTNIKATQPSGANFSKLLTELAKPMAKEKVRNAEFEFAMPDGKVIRYFSDLPGEASVGAMESYLECKARLNELQSHLADLRKQYAAGDKALSQQILDLEREELQVRSELKRLKNVAINAYMR